MNNKELRSPQDLKRVLLNAWQVATPTTEKYISCATTSSRQFHRWSWPISFYNHLWEGSCHNYISKEVFRSFYGGRWFPHSCRVTRWTWLAWSMWSAWMLFVWYWSYNWDNPKATPLVLQWELWHWVYIIHTHLSFRLDLCWLLPCIRLSIL